MTKEIQEIVDSLEQTICWCDKITTGNLPHKIANLKHSLINSVELLKMLKLGWHPASELPPNIGQNPCYVRVVDNKWNKNNLKWWCYPSEND